MHDELHELYQKHLQQVKFCEEEIRELYQNYDTLIQNIWEHSPFLKRLINKNFEFFIKMLSGGFDATFENLLQEIDNSEYHSKKQTSDNLRIFKQKAALTIACGEISTHWDGCKAMANLSIFADKIIRKATQHLFYSYQDMAILVNDEKIATDEIIANSGLVLLAMGKLGSYELNYSSDIDLIIFFEDGKLSLNPKYNSQTFFIKYAKDIVDIISSQSEHGYVFRVDMRLRPDPAANPLAVSLDKAEKYYFTVGQNWERAAMIKSRFICGDTESYSIFQNFMNKNVWRKALDFETIEDIHSIKRQIDSKVGIHPENLLGYDLKIGHGGIREIEFFCQTQQLIWGGRKFNLRTKKTIEALKELAIEKEITEETAKDLTECYLFFRFVEHRLQMINDEQTHQIPQNTEKLENLAKFCNFPSVDEFTEKLMANIEIVRKYYSKLFESSPPLTASVAGISGSLVFTGTENNPETLETLSNLGFENPDIISNIIRGWHHGRYNCTVKKRSRAVLTKLIPNLLSIFATANNCDNAFIKLDEFLSRLPAGSQIFSLLYLNPSIMQLLAEILGSYKKLTATLLKNPELLDYVLSPEFYNSLPDKKYMRKNLDQIINYEDFEIEEQFEQIKDWAGDRKFRLGVQLIRNEITTEEVAQGLSNIADIVILKLDQLIKNHYEQEHQCETPGYMATIAFGKLGSEELTFNTDIDLVFVYDVEDNMVLVGDNKIDLDSYFIKYASKMNYALSSITRTGKLYETDLRLRPLGDAGPIATRFETFDKYYNRSMTPGSAWIWEYMALLRARVLCNDKDYKKKLEDTIRDKLMLNFPHEVINGEVTKIYKKLRESKPRNNDIFDLKYSTGGIFDLEFMIRYLQLYNIADIPELYERKTGKTIKLLARHQIISQEHEQKLQYAFFIFSSIQNILRISSEVQINDHMVDKIASILDLESKEIVAQLLQSCKKDVSEIFAQKMDFMNEDEHSLFMA